MGFRFHKSLKILPGIRLNFSKSGASLSLGGRGLTYNIGTKGNRATVGLPGSGMSYTSYSAHKKEEGDAPAGNEIPWKYIWLGFVIVLGITVFAVKVFN